MAARGHALPEAVDMVREHLQRALTRGGGADAAVAKGDAVWVSSTTGERLPRRGPGAVLWPVSNGKVWEMDHGIELQHGGHDSVDNYIPAPSHFHRLKSDAMNTFGKLIRERLENE